MSRFFIDRPIFAWVLGNSSDASRYFSDSKCYLLLSTRQLRHLQLVLLLTYPGASARTLEDTVTQVIEQKMKGLRRLTLYVVNI